MAQWIKTLSAIQETHEMHLIPGSGRSHGGGHGNPLQYSCLENPMDRGAWRATVHRVEKNQTRLKQLGMHAEKEVAPATEGKQPRLEPKS